jgi:undecaprenyl-diphosphatase
MNELTNILILAVLQGLTEFLPVSSSGHLAIAGHLLGLKENGMMVSVVLHAGTLLSILIVYCREILSLFKDPEKRPIFLAVLLATIPIGGIGFLVACSGVMDMLVANLYCPGIGLCITGMILFLAFRVDPKTADKRKDITKITLKDALIIGLAQVPALLPGISRSGMTISTGLKRNLTPTDAAQFSFLMAIPAIGGAALVEPLIALHKSGDITGGVPVYMLILGFITSAVVGVIAVKILFISLKRGSFKGYAYYCIALGIASILWQFFT